METLFFVFLGLTFQITGGQIFSNLMIGMKILFVLLLFRILSTTISTRSSELGENWKEIVLDVRQGVGVCGIGHN